VRAGSLEDIIRLFAYAACRIPEISDDIVNVDNSMKWGFGWSHGPFEIWDAMGVRGSVEQMKKEGKTFPSWIDRLLEQPDPRFYKTEKGKRFFWDLVTGFEAEQPPGY
jgi:3-hydroxyacyl-CoA dehydrogenase